MLIQGISAASVINIHRGGRQQASDRALTTRIHALPGKEGIRADGMAAACGHKVRYARTLGLTRSAEPRASPDVPAQAYADARAQTIYGVTSEIMKTIIARGITGLRT
jgi:alkylation response protein AidB-like acyl-CoA dehydrogenase